MVGVINADTLADRWVTKELLTIDWDLVVVDSANTLSPRAEGALRQLLGEGAVRRLLALGLAGRPDRHRPLGSLHGLHVTDWGTAMVDDPSTMAFAYRFRPVFFERSAEEREV